MSTAILTRIFFLCSLIVTACHSWVSTSTGNSNAESKSRRQLFQSFTSRVTTAGIVLTTVASPSGARNLPVSNGAVDALKCGTVDALAPIVMLRYSLSRLQQQLANRETINLEGFPVTEEKFKLLFDAYSDPVSYKQKFLDQNAFLVYYTKGFDGPGRPTIEDDINERQTLQFGARNESWLNWENFLTELKFIDDADNDSLGYLKETIKSVDSYLKFAPPADVKEAQLSLGISW